MLYLLTVATLLKWQRLFLYFLLLGCRGERQVVEMHRIKFIWVHGWGYTYLKVKRSVKQYTVMQYLSFLFTFFLIKAVFAMHNFGVPRQNTHIPNYKTSTKWYSHKKRKLYFFKDNLNLPWKDSNGLTDLAPIFSSIYTIQIILGFIVNLVRVCSGSCPCHWLGNQPTIVI